MNERSEERLSTADIAAGGQQSTTTGDRRPETTDEEARAAAQERAIQRLEERERGTGRTEAVPADQANDRGAVPVGTGGSTDASAGTPGSSDMTAPAARGAAAQGVGEPTEATDADERPAPLFTEQDAESYRGRWREVQAGFVDNPRNAVELADSMVAELMQKLAEGFAGQRATLEQQWDRQGEPSTEELRVTLQRYRSFFDRLLSL